MAERQNPMTVVNNLVTDTKAVVLDNLALAKAEVTPSAKAAGVGGGMFGAAGYLAANAASLLFLAGGFGFAKLFSGLLNWGPLPSIALGFVAMALVLLLLAGILAMIGKSKMKQVKPPEQAIKEAKVTAETVKQSLASGVNEVNANVRDRHGLVVAKRAAKDLDGTTAYQASSSTGATRL
ncbi:phage holin family protein [Luteococcus sp. H138]|uniref:phage holin family protein n=1 Tax=unclassified Luteococcus TaxID=2639923 RepID=UPI00313DC15B